MGNLGNNNVRTNSGYFESVFPLSESNESVLCPVKFWSRGHEARVALRMFSLDTTCPEGSKTESPPSEILTYGDLDALIGSIQVKLQRMHRDSDTLHQLEAKPAAETIATLFACFRERIPIVLNNARTPQSEPVQLISLSETSRESPEKIGTLSERIDLDCIATALFTSGTSGRPKMAAHSIRNHFESAIASCRRVPLAPSDCWLLSLDISHVGGLGIMFRSLLSGASISMVKSGWSPKAVQIPGVTHLSLVATQLKQLLDLPPDEHTSARHLLVGGGPVPAKLIQQAIKMGYEIRTTYGLTELASQVSTSLPWNHAQEYYSSGSLLEHCEARIREDGVLLLRGKSVFLGYLEEGRLATAVDSKGWFCTNDLVKIEERELYVHGRSDSMFISGGENIQPEEIEEVLLSLVGVERAVVVSVPDEDYGSRPFAFVKIDADQTTIEQVRKELSAILPGYKIRGNRSEFQRLAFELISG